MSVGASMGMMDVAAGPGPGVGVGPGVDAVSGMRLERTGERVRCTQGPVVVATWAWVARFEVGYGGGGSPGTESGDGNGYGLGSYNNNGKGKEREEIGEGWRGEWVIQAEGTMEGKNALMEWLDTDAATAAAAEPGGGERDGRVIREFEVIRDRCSARRTWLRLLTRQTHNTSDLSLDSTSTDELS